MRIIFKVDLTKQLKGSKCHIEQIPDQSPWMLFSCMSC